MCEKIKYVNIQNGEELDLNTLKELKENSMLKVKPNLWIEWDFENNKELDVFLLTHGSNRKVCWICPKCESKYSAKITHRITSSNCPYCNGKKVNNTNSLAVINPELAKQWHPIKNIELTPNGVSPNSHKKVWWLGYCSHEWEASVANRSKGTNCPYCSSKNILKGFNDMWTTNPELAKLLVNHEDGYKYSENSDVSLDWKCQTCQCIVKNKIIKNVNRQGLSCLNCTDGISYGEKLFINILNEISEDFICQKTFEWSNNKRYDFYLPKSNTIIEIHGSQHYDNSFSYRKGRTLEEEKINDLEKRRLAERNGISNYVEINASKSNYSFIMNSIKKSNLLDIIKLENINWKEIDCKSRKSIFHNVVKYWKIKMTCDEIAKKENIHISTVRSYLRKAEDLGICDYKKRDY